MSEPYLIAHLVRGTAAFDIATQMPCPECHSIGCPECDELGYWWMIPTSGHRAYPYWSQSLKSAYFDCDAVELSYNGFTWTDITDVPNPPAGTPDHYPHSASPVAPRGALALALGLALRPASAPIKRRV